MNSRGPGAFPYRARGPHKHHHHIPRRTGAEQHDSAGSPGHERAAGMNHFQMDDGTDSESRVMQAGTAAFGLYARCGVWVSRNLTDGFVPVEVAGMYGTREWIDKLVGTRLWSPVDGGLWMPDYLEGHGNWSAERIVAHRAAAAERKARSRSRHVINQDDDMSRRDSHVSHRESHARVTIPHTHPITTTTNTSSSADADDAPSDPKPKPTRKTKPRTVPPRFDEFWNNYPRRVGKINAEKAFAKAIAEGTDPQLIIDAVRLYAMTCSTREPQFIKHPASWLNAGCWDDDDPATRPSPPPVPTGTCRTHSQPLGRDGTCISCAADAKAVPDDPWAASGPFNQPPF